MALSAHAKAIGCRYDPRPMRTSTEWLSDFLSPVPPMAEAGEALTMGGFPVEQFDKVGAVDVMEVEVTSNRPDLLCHAGVARELAALTGGRFSLQFKMPAHADELAEAVTSVEIERIDLCPYYTARILRNVKIGPSPQWMQRRLEQVGLRPINNVVDATNYVLFELGQPLHAFDFDKLAGGRIVVRNARKGETLKTLDGMERVLTPDMLVIADAEKPAALAGVMGGELSQVTDATTSILLESARFDSLNVRNTSRRLKLMSDSSYRFERGLDPTLAERAADRAAALILESAGGELLQGHAEAGLMGWKSKSLLLSFSELRRLLGVDLPHEEIFAAFERLELSPRAVSGGIETKVPSHRLDIAIEADLVEEAARILGYDRIPLREQITVTVKPADPVLQAIDAMRDVLTAAGYFEAVTMSFVSDALQAQFLPERAKLRRVDPNVRKADGHLRPSLLPGLLESVRYNETVGNGAVKLFEAGGTFLRNADGAAVERRRLAFVGGESYAECRGVVELLLARLDRSKSVVVEPAVSAGFGEGACGWVMWGSEVVGHVGMLDRAVVEKMDLSHRPAMAELDLEPLIKGFRPIPEHRPMSRFPAARRDVSLTVKEDVPYADLAVLATELNLADLESIEHAATYRGKPLEKGEKSVTMTLVFRRSDSTVAREAADAEVQRLVSAAAEKVGAAQRV